LDIAGGDILMLGLTTIVYMGLVLIIEMTNFNYNWNNKDAKPNLVLE